MIVSAHAISRYRERVEPVDHDTAHARILAALERTRAMILGNCEVILPRGHKLVIKDGTVVTVRPKWKPERKRRYREFEE